MEWTETQKRQFAAMLRLRREIIDLLDTQTKPTSDVAIASHLGLTEMGPLRHELEVMRSTSCNENGEWYLNC